VTETAAGSSSASLPETGVAQLRRLIERVASGQAPVETLIATFQGLYEATEQAGRIQYQSKEEARLIWDVLWMLEFYSADPQGETNPSEWNSAADVLAEVQRVARRFQAL
jgi:hypothetical protein